jgi:hypothetical protein
MPFAMMIMLLHWIISTATLITGQSHCLYYMIKKLNWQGKKRPHCIALRRNLSQSSRENP